MRDLGWPEQSTLLPVCVSGQNSLVSLSPGGVIRKRGSSDTWQLVSERRYSCKVPGTRGNR